MELKRVKIDVIGVPPADRNYFCGIIQRHLVEHQKLDPVFDCKDGDGRIVSIDCCEFRFPAIRVAIVEALAGHYIAEPKPLIKPAHDPAQAIAA